MTESVFINVNVHSVWGPVRECSENHIEVALDPSCVTESNGDPFRVHTGWGAVHHYSVSHDVVSSDSNEVAC